VSENISVDRTVTVPEPGSALLLLVGVAVSSRFRKKLVA
jgi:hypothetical protein